MAKLAIDPTTTFNAQHYFKAIRKAGQNPRIQRLTPGKTVYARDVKCDGTSAKRALATAAYAWAAAQDPTGTQQAEYLRSFISILPAEPAVFELALG